MDMGELQSLQRHWLQAVYGKTSELIRSCIHSFSMCFGCQVILYTEDPKVGKTEDDNGVGLGNAQMPQWLAGARLAVKGRDGNHDGLGTEVQLVQLKAVQSRIMACCSTVQNHQEH